MDFVLRAVEAVRGFQVGDDESKEASGCEWGRGGWEPWGWGLVINRPETYGQEQWVEGTVEETFRGRPGRSGIWLGGGGRNRN